MIRFLKSAEGANPLQRLKTEIADADMQGLLDAWLQLVPECGLPDKSSFDPLGHPTLLPRMWIYELTEDRHDFVGRLSGEEIRHVWGKTTKGMPLSRIASPERFYTSYRRWLYCVTAPAVLLGRSTEQKQAVVTRLSLPFTDGDGRLYVLGASRYDFGLVDPYQDRHPFRHSQQALAVRVADLVRCRAAGPDSTAPHQAATPQAAMSSRTWAAQASPSACKS